MSDVLEPAIDLSHDHVMSMTLRKAASVIDRVGYKITGYVLTHHEHPRKCIVDMATVRWFPDGADFTRMMNGRETRGPETPEEGFEFETLVAAIEPAPLAPVTVVKPSIAAHASRPMIESVEQAIGELAKELGCHHNALIPHNTGWFVPGKANAYASAFDAITALFANLSDGGTVYKANAEKIKPAPAPKIDAAPAQVPQADLF